MVNTELFNNYDLNEVFGVNLPAVVRTLHDVVQAAKIIPYGYERRLLWEPVETILLRAKQADGATPSPYVSCS